MVADRDRKEPPGSSNVPSLGHIHVNDLVMLIYCSVHVTPHARDLHIGLVHEPAVTNTVSARSSRVDQLRGESLYPPVDRDVINLYPAFCQEFLDIAVRKAVAEIPAHSQQDHVGREPETSERRRCRTATTDHPGTLRPAPDPSTQQSRLSAGTAIASLDHVAEIRSLRTTLASWRTEILNRNTTGSSKGPTRSWPLRQLAPRQALAHVSHA